MAADPSIQAQKSALRPAPSLAELVREGLAQLAREGKPGTQTWLAQQLKVTEPFLSKTLNGARASSDSEIVAIAEILELPIDEALLAASALRCRARATEERDKVTELAAQRTDQGGERKGRKQSEEAEAREQSAQQWDRAAERYNTMLGETRIGREQRRSPANARSEANARGFVSLEDFPYICGSKWAIVAGDRREQRPKGRGDVVALSVSTSDFMFVAGLKLPEDSLVLSDKILRVASEANLKELLGKNLLLIGSSAVNLLTREMMRQHGASMVFNVPAHWYAREEAVYKSLGDTIFTDEEKVEELLQETKEEVNVILPNFMKSGFVDPIVDPIEGRSGASDRSGWVRGTSRRVDRDYGMIALAPNPWSPDHVVCICAGVGGGGTAGALMLLGNPAQFVNRPWGGVFKVNLPDQVAWERRFQYLWPKWDTKGYTPDHYVEQARRLVEKVTTFRNTGKRDDMAAEVNVSTDVLQRMLEIGEKLSKRPVSA